MDSGQFGAEQFGMDSEQTGMDSLVWTVGYGQRTVWCGQWGMDSVCSRMFQTISKCFTDFGVVSSFKCFVVYLKAFRRPSTFISRCSLSNFIEPFISIPEVFTKAPAGCTWSYRIMTPTITRKQNNLVSWFLNLEQ